MAIGHEGEHVLGRHAVEIAVVKGRDLVERRDQVGLVVDLRVLQRGIADEGRPVVNKTLGRKHAGRERDHLDEVVILRFGDLVGQELGLDSREVGYIEVHLDAGDLLKLRSQIDVGHTRRVAVADAAHLGAGIGRRRLLERPSLRLIGVDSSHGQNCR